MIGIPIVLTDKMNNKLMYLITCLFSRCPEYVTTYISGAQNSNSRSQFTIVDNGTQIKKGPSHLPSFHNE